MENCSNKPTILITGFGPFGGSGENGTMKLVEILSTMNLEEELGVNLKTYILNTEYKCVMDKIPHLWSYYTPKLVIHLGETSSVTSNQIDLEKHANNVNYIRLDVTSCLPCNGKCIKDGPEQLSTELDIHKVANEVKVADYKITVSLSAGRYLCEFIYYRSLYNDTSRVVFIHVPVLRRASPNSESSFQSVASSLASIVKHLYKQVVENDKKKESV